MVWDRPYEVEVDQRSKTVFVASGDYKGKLIVTKDQTAGAALKRWRESATYKGS
jgi:hypothetical protein